MAYWILLWHKGRWQQVINRFIPLYSYFLMIYCLPFFFTAMALKNGVNDVWMASAICSVLYLMEVLDTLNMAVAHAIGTSLGIFYFFATTDGASIPESALEYFPILAFAFAGALLYDYTEDAIEGRNAARMRAVAAVGGSVAHEMRTPLLGIRMDAEGLRQYLPLLLETYDRAVQAGIDVPPLNPEERQGIASALDRIERQTAFANTVITMLLVNVGSERIDPAAFAVHRMAEVVAHALDAYPFKAGERERLVWRCAADFAFLGSDLLMRHVLFNLLKNGLRATAEAGRGTVDIRLEPGDAANRLIVRDTGTGVPPDLLPQLFEPFVTSARDGERAGIGLAFCRRVIESFEGRIVCRSERGSFTEFEITLPRV